MDRGSVRRAYPKYVLMVLGVAALAVVGTMIHKARLELAALKPHRWSVPRPPGETWLAPARDVALPTAGGPARGWLLPSSNGAAVLLVSGTAADRTQLATEARLLAQAGYGVLVFDLPGQGESEGTPWQGGEQGAMTAAVDLLASQPETEPRRIGALGFSVGAALVADAAARDPRLRAVLLEGCFTDWEELTRYQQRTLGVVSQWPAVWVDRLYAPGGEALSPLARVAAMAPRPLLLVTGSNDSVVPPDHAIRLYAAASSPKELWTLRGAGHGGYSAAAPEEYARRIVGFFDRALPAVAATPSKSP